MAMARHLRLLWRATLGPESRLSWEELIEACPGNPDDVRRWLTEHVPSCGSIGPVEVYRWGDALAAMTNPRPEVPGTAWLSTSEAAARLGIARSTLDEMLSRSPKDLPGSPVHVGNGSARQHLRWDAGRLQEWLTAYRSWEASSGRKGLVAPSRVPQRTTRRVTSDDDGPVDWAAVSRTARRG